MEQFSRQQKVLSQMTTTAGRVQGKSAASQHNGVRVFRQAAKTSNQPVTRGPYSALADMASIQRQLANKRQLAISRGAVHDEWRLTHDVVEHMP